jgi:heat shock protein HslJ
MTLLRRLAAAAAIPALVAMAASPALAASGAPSGGRITGDWERTSAGIAQSVTFAKDGSVSGDAGCNRIIGTYTVDGSTIDIGPLATTLMYCEGVMEAEQAFIKALEKSTSFAVKQDRLKLYGPKGKVTVTLTRG